MSENSPPPGYHHDPDRFREAINYTASITGFGSLLIEKDYYCSLVLQDLAAFFHSSLVFKGGTCLSKVHLDFFRLSEDLDFVIPTPVTATASKRSAAVLATRQHLASLRERHACFKESQPLRGHNASRQYNGAYSYRSVITGEDEPISLEIALREPILLPTEQRNARTLLTDPFTRQPAFDPVVVSVLSINEAYSEKLRAALTRKDPAIRDFFDIDCAIRKGILNHQDVNVLDLVRQKLAIPGNLPIDISPEKRDNLQRQIAAQLASVLRKDDYDSFDLERAFAIVAEVARLCSEGS